jgi:hypothetical protein
MKINPVITLLFVAIISIVAIAACTPTGCDIVSTDTGIIYGHTTDSADGTPIPNVDVTLPGTTFSTKSDSQGNYCLKGVTPGNYTIFAETSGLSSSELPVQVAANQKSLQDLRLFILHKAPTQGPASDLNLTPGVFKP